MPTLHRTLSLWDLILYGMIVITPTAGMLTFGVVSQRSNGHTVTAILLAMFAMLLTAISYGRMARAYPSAGSAFTYVGSEIHPGLGYVTGWSMTMDYMLIPIVCTILLSKYVLDFVPGLSYTLLVFFFVCVLTGLNLVGIRSSARINAALTAAMIVVIAICLVSADHYVLKMPHSGMDFFMRPFYDPQRFSISAVLGGTSLAVLAYIGFDGISTLSEEAEDPKRNVLLATVLVCVITGVLAGLEAYFAQLVWPSSQSFPDVDTAFVHVAGRAGGPWLFNLVNLTLLVAAFGSALGGQLGAARLLYGMGRSDVIPKSFFGVIEPKHRIPRNSTLFIGAMALLGASFLSFERAAELLNFGALLAFMGVNAAAFVRYVLRERRRTWSYILVPILGFTVCLLLWLNLSRPAKIWGAVWMLLGVTYGAIRTQGFKAERVSFEIPGEEAGVDSVGIG